MKSVNTFSKNPWLSHSSVLFPMHILIIFVKRKRLCSGGIIGKKCFILEIHRIHNLKEDDSPPANNKLTRMLADGSLEL